MQLGNVPTRGRFFHFLFSGIAFSTGGYSAEYGEAPLRFALNTEDNPAQNKTEISLMTVGVGLGNTQKWNKSSLSQCVLHQFSTLSSCYSSKYRLEQTVSVLVW
jgi:hypothetical protein